jgi:hypothetical protein
MPEENKDLKGGEGQPGGDGQPLKTGGGSGAEETITVKKSDYDKLNSDLVNYRNVALKVKADERDLKKASGEGDGGTGNTMDEAKVKEISRAEASSLMGQTRKSNESRAKKSFLEHHKEYIDDVWWNGLVSHLRLRGDEATPEDYSDRLEEAILLHKRESGQLEGYLKSEHERGKREGRIESEFDSAQNAGGAGDRGGEGSGSAGTLSPKGEEMARGMHIDPETARKVDPSKDNVIDVTK